MPAELFVFPSPRRGAFVRKLAAQMCANSSDAAERILQARLVRHADNLAKKGIRADRVSADVRALEATVRVELWRRVLLDGGAA